VVRCSAQEVKGASRWALRGSNCNPVRATSEVSTHWASVVMMALDFDGGSTRICAKMA
jgi:hypothetical protein